MLNKITPYLQGTKFSNSLEIRLNSLFKSQNQSRVELIKKYVNSKKVLHVGCCDHIPLIKDKAKRNEWMHEELSKVCSKVIGIDNNKEALDYIKNEMNATDVFEFDLIKDSTPPFESQFDFILLGEILEHTPNPIEFLTAIHKKYKGKITNIIVTVPNALRLANFKNSIRNKEIINSDHYYEFSPYTLSRVLHNSGFKILELNTAFYDSVKKHGFFHKMIYNKYNILRDDLIAVASFE